MKNYCFVLLILLCVGFKLNHALDLMCEFEIIKIYDRDSYSCRVNPRQNIFSNTIVTGRNGIHNASKNDNDVKGIVMKGFNVKRIPQHIGSLFDLTALIIINSQLNEIKDKDFQNMHNLEVLSFYSNQITAVPTDALINLPNLKLISFSSNKLEELKNNVFSNNVKLEIIYLYNNRIKYFGSNLFNELKNLKLVDLSNNTCLSKKYEGERVRIQLMSSIELCKNPNEIQSMMEMHIKIINLESENIQLKNKLSELTINQKKNQNDWINTSQNFNKKNVYVERVIAEQNNKLNEATKNHQSCQNQLTMTSQNLQLVNDQLNKINFENNSRNRNPNNYGIGFNTHKTTRHPFYKLLGRI